MKIKEIIVEFKAKLSGTVEPLSTSINDSLPGVYVQRELRNTDPYMQYRYGLAVASVRAIKNGDLRKEDYAEETAFSENLTQVMYAKEDEETIKMASELFGVTPTQIANSKSCESDKINKVSPVAKKTKNKYGV